MEAKVPKWEQELWSYVSAGDGKHCPFLSHCSIKQFGGWCADRDGRQLDRLYDYDEENFNLGNFDSVTPMIAGKPCKLGKMVEMLAQQWLKKGRVRSPPVPTELVLLSDEHNSIEVRLVPLKAYHGAIWSLQDKWVIQLRDDDPSPTQRFTLFHELFHILAHSKCSPVFRKMGDSCGSFNELLASHFAICTLMPEEWVEKKWVEVKDLGQMAEIFDVPKSLMCVRLRRLGLI